MKFLERSLDQQNQFWKYLVVILVAFFGGQIIGAIPLICVIAAKVASNGGASITDMTNPTDLTIFGISKNLSLFLMMIPFIVSFILLVILIKGLHKRSLSETVNGTNKVRISRFWTGMAVWGLLMVIYLLGDYMINPDNFVLQFDLANFIPLLLISILIIPIQTTFEELLCRGYLAQGIAGWTKNRWAVIILPGLFFALLHIGNPEVKEYGFWMAMPQYLFFGLLFGFVAVLDDGIELPMGMHAANNVFLSIFATNKSSALQTNAIFEQLNINPVRETIILVIMGIIAIAYFAWKYKWNFRILSEKVTAEDKTEEGMLLS